MYLFILILTMKFMVSPIAGFEYDMPERLWDVIELVISIYVGGRSVEKIAPLLAAIKNKKEGVTENPPA